MNPRGVGGGGGGFLALGLTVARQPFAMVKDFAVVRVAFAAAKGPVLPIFPFSFFLRFFSKNLQHLKKIMENSPKGILISS